MKTTNPSVVTEDISFSPKQRRQSSEHSLTRDKVTVDPSGYPDEVKDWSPLMRDFDRRLDGVERKLAVLQD